MEFEQQLINDINSCNWGNYLGPANYDSKKIIPAFTKLIYLRDEQENNKTYNEVLFAIGNNHAGTYYPVVLKALPFIIKIAKNNEHEIVKNCALEIISDLYYCFQPELGTFNKITKIELESFVKNAIKQFINQSNHSGSNRNKNLISELIDFINEETTNN